MAKGTIQNQKKTANTSSASFHSQENLKILYYRVYIVHL